MILNNWLIFLFLCIFFFSLSLSTFWHCYTLFAMFTNEDEDSKIYVILKKGILNPYWWHFTICIQNTRSLNLGKLMTLKRKERWAKKIAELEKLDLKNKFIQGKEGREYTAEIGNKQQGGMSPFHAFFNNMFWMCIQK